MNKPQQRTLCVSVKPEHLARLQEATVRFTAERGRIMTKSELVREALDLLLPPSEPAESRLSMPGPGDTPKPPNSRHTPSQEATAHDLERVRANIRAAVNAFLRDRRRNGRQVRR